MATPVDWSCLEASFPWLACLPPAARLAASLRRLEPCEALFRVGQRPKAMWCLLSGEVRLVRASSAGHEVVLQRTRHDFLAEASLNVRSYHCDAVAVEMSELLCLPRQAFVQALADAAFCSAWLDHLAREVRGLRARCERLSLKSAADRIVHAIETEGAGGRLRLTSSRKIWAAELGLTHEALYRTLRQMREAGILTVEGDVVEIGRDT